MSIAARASALIERRAQGRTLTLRRPNNLNVSPVLANALSAGQTALVLKGATKLTGRVVKNSRFTVAGVTGTYTVLADALTPTTGLLSLTFTPAIPTAQSAGVGAAVTFTQNYEESSYPFLRRDTLAEDEKTIEGGTQARLLPFITGKPAPTQLDRLDGVPILRVKTVDTDDGVGYYRCIIGDTPS